MATRKAERREDLKELRKVLFALVVGAALTPLSKRLEKLLELPGGRWVAVAGLVLLAFGFAVLMRTPKRFLIVGVLGLAIAAVIAAVVDHRSQSSINVEVGGRRLAGFSPQDGFTGAVEVRPGDTLELDVTLKGKGDVGKGTKIAVTVPRNPGPKTNPEVAALQAGLKRDAKDQLLLKVSSDQLVRLGSPTRFRYRRRETLLKSDDDWKTLSTRPPQETTRQFHVEIASTAFGQSNRFKEVQFEFLVEVQAG